MNNPSGSKIEKVPGELMENPDQLFLGMLEKIVVANLSNEQLGVQELALAMELSRFLVYRSLNAITGKSISLFIREIRLNRAMEWLRAGSGTASEIAYEVGFGSATYFNKCFYEYFKITPGEVLKNLNHQRHGVQIMDRVHDKKR